MLRAANYARINHLCQNYYTKQKTALEQKTTTKVMPEVSCFGLTMVNSRPDPLGLLEAFKRRRYHMVHLLIPSGVISYPCVSCSAFIGDEPSIS